MSEEKVLSYRYGITGHVELYKNIARKYSEFNVLYWLKEHAMFLYTWPFKTDNIIKYESSCILNKICPKSQINKKYYEIAFKRYPITLHERRFYRDNEIIQFLLDISSALAFLHSHNISHRDIKPANIAISDTGRSILIDFSHSHRMITPLIRLDPQVVTFYYRAPEVFKYQENEETPYDMSIDIYSLGMVLIEILTGASFAEYYTKHENSNSSSEMMYRLFLRDAKKSFSFIKEYFDMYKRNFIYVKKYWDWIVKMIAYEPSNRIKAMALYKSVKEFADSHKISYIVPENGPLEVKMLKLETYNINCDESLKNKCLQHLNAVRYSYKLLLDPIRVIDVIKFLINDKFITDSNYQEKISALAIILETVVFDGVSDLSDYGDLNCKFVRDSIIEIVSKYDQHLFGQNSIFKYKALEE
jgi:serine/threonine protein kinase